MRILAYMRSNKADHSLQNILLSINCSVGSLLHRLSVPCWNIDEQLGKQLQCYPGEADLVVARAVLLYVLKPSVVYSWMYLFFDSLLLRYKGLMMGL